MKPPADPKDVFQVVFNPAQWDSLLQYLDEHNGMLMRIPPVGEVDEIQTYVAGIKHYTPLVQK